MRKGFFDKILSKVVSRKLLVFATATTLMIVSDLTSDVWGMIAVVYIGGQSAVDTMLAYKYGKSEEGKLVEDRIEGSENDSL